MSAEIQVPPADEHNQTLVRNTHPPDWQNPRPAERYNLVVIGAGTAGLITAVGAAGLGAKVALVEKHLIGGDCLNVGCVPSKALIRAARAVAAVREAEQFGVLIEGTVRVDFPAIMERMRKLRAKISHHDAAARFRELGVDIFFGAGRFVDEQSIQVGDQRLRFHQAVIATGARAAELPIPGLLAAGCLTNETIFELTSLPPRLGVIGAGPIGAELSQAFARFGSKVTLFERDLQILTKEDPQAVAVLMEQMQRDGVQLMTATELLEIRREGQEKVIACTRNGRRQEIRVDEILLGAGRQPNVAGLGLEAVKVDYDERTGVRVNDQLQTTNPKIYACGDVCSRLKFTHAADFQARLVLRNALFPGSSKASALTIPWCTYTSPEIAHVGLDERAAKQQGIEIDTFTQPLDGVDRAILDGETQGFVKIHLRKGSDKILGATIAAEHAGDMISEITLAMTNGLGLSAIGRTIHPYPTQTEAIRKVGDLYNKTRLTPFRQKLLKKWLAWFR